MPTCQADRQVLNSGHTMKSRLAISHSRRLLTRSLLQGTFYVNAQPLLVLFETPAVELDVALCQSILSSTGNKSMVACAEEPNRPITYREVDVR